MEFDLKITQLIPDVDAFLALEPEELGLRILPMLEQWSRSNLSDLQLAAVNEAVLSAYQNGSREEIKRALREVWAWLEGSALLIPSPRYLGHHDVRILSRKALRLAQDTNPSRTYRARHLLKDSLHPKIREDVWSLFHRNKFETAVFEAMKAVEVSVREAAGLAASDIGTKLMRKAFDVESGPLTDKNSEPSERQARSDLFAGAIGSYKNPHSHRNVALEDPDEAAEIIFFANHLLRIVDACRGQ